MADHDLIDYRSLDEELEDKVKLLDSLKGFIRRLAK
jgi:hypothetical protein